MLTPAQRHRQRVLARQESERAAGDAIDPNRSEYELMLAKLASDKRRLHEIKGMERKAVVKLEMLPEYSAYLEGVLEADGGADDQVLATWMVWAIDIGDYHLALDLGDYVLRHGLPMPDQYKRTAAEVLAEEVAELTIKSGSISAYMPELQRTLDLVDSHDMPDQVRAKLHKALGLSFEPINKSKSIDHLKRAMQLDDKSGVKRKIEEIERAMKKQAEAKAEG